MDAADGEGGVLHRGGDQSPGIGPPGVPEEKGLALQGVDGVPAVIAEGVDRLLRVPLGGVHRAEVEAALEPLQGRLVGEAGAEDEQQSQGEQQQEHHIAAQAAPGREPQAGERAFHDCTPSFRSGISTRKVWPNTFPSSHKCSASSGGSWGRMIQRLTPE